MSSAEKFLLIIQQVLPSPFTIAVLLTLLTFLFAFFFTTPEQPIGRVNQLFLLGEYWQNGFWDFLKFAMQMMLILVLGHTLALTTPATRFINLLLPFCTNTARAAFWVTLISLLAAYINWGLGLILGAILARKVGEYAAANNINMNYPLIGAAGYAGLMVWHGGLSGSAPLKVAEAGHSLVNQIGIIPAGETLGSELNIAVVICTIIMLPILMYYLGIQSTEINNVLPASIQKEEPKINTKAGAEQLDHAKWLAYAFGGLMILLSLKTWWQTPDKLSLSFLNLNFINFFLFGLGLIFHGSISNFVNATGEAIKGATGILIQFPLYAGIMGIMSSSGLITDFSAALISYSTTFTFPILTFISAAVVNIFVPSGGGQWIIQGPIVVEAAQALGVPIGKSIMALAYGDQLTNMLQPFWALPLLGITGLKAKQLLPYTFVLFLAGSVIFTCCLLLF